MPEAERTLDNPEWVDFLLFDNQGEIRVSLRPFFPSPRHAQIVVRLQGNLSLDDEGADATLVEEAAAELDFQDASTVTTGAPILLQDINDYLRGGMLTLGAIAVAIMAVILLLLFDVRWRLLPLVVIMVGVIWAFGLAGYLGIPLTHRHHRRPPRHARRRHRLRDPDARPRRGGGGHRPRPTTRSRRRPATSARPCWW